MIKGERSINCQLVLNHYAFYFKSHKLNYQEHLTQKSLSLVEQFFFGKVLIYAASLQMN